MVRVSISAWYLFSSTLQSLYLESQLLRHALPEVLSWVGESEDRPLSLADAVCKSRWKLPPTVTRIVSRILYHSQGTYISPTGQCL